MNPKQPKEENGLSANLQKSLVNKVVGWSTRDIWICGHFLRSLPQTNYFTLFNVYWEDFQHIIYDSNIADVK